MRRRRFSVLTGFLWPFRWHLAGLAMLTAALSALAMLPPLLVRALIDRVIAAGEHDRFALLAVAMLAAPTLSALCGFLQVITTAYTGQAVVTRVRCALYQHLLRLSARFYGKHSVGMLVNRLMSDTGNIQQLLTVASVQVVADLVCATFAVTVTFSLNWRLASLLIAIVGLFVVNYRINIGRIRRATRGHRGAQDRLATGIQNRLVGDLTVKTFGAEPREQDVFREQSSSMLDLVRESQAAANTFTMNTMLLQRLGHAAIYFAGCAMVLTERASYGDVLAFAAYAMQLLMPAVRFSSLAHQIQDVGISLDRLGELFGEAPEITAPPRAQRPARIEGRVDFDAVSFEYEPGVPVLREFDLHVAAGSTVALVGPTGCGKSTVLSLLLRFFDVQEGAVRIDGVDIREMDPRALRRQFGIVLQESLLFDVSIADNIRYSRPSATRADIEHAARVAEIHDFVATLPEGYDSLLGSQGVQLSIGQKQRVNIARAVLADPAILIMDEATSALDSESERAIQTAMERFLVGRTSFIVAHRLSTVRNADRIVILREGVIEESGTHDELMRIADGRYRELYLKHAGKGVITEE